jgi:hypothetical protein
MKCSKTCKYEKNKQCILHHVRKQYQSSCEKYETTLEKVLSLYVGDIGFEYDNKYFIKDYGMWIIVDKRGLRYEPPAYEMGYSDELLEKEYQKSKREEKLKRILDNENI